MSGKTKKDKGRLVIIRYKGEISCEEALAKIIKRSLLNRNICEGKQGR
jgi:hypothetical protein